MKLKRVIRLDSMPLNKAFFTEEGYLIDTPIVTSTGIFEYSNPDGSIRRELRLPEEVFDPDSLASYQAKPVILTHDAGLVTKDNVGENEIGTILTKGFRDRDNVRAKIVIHDTDEMKRSGLKELSLGYNLDLDETPGTWNGEHYDAIQRNIRINHLALVREARAGEQARLNIDSKDAKKGAKVMTKKRRKARRADGILSPEELKKAIEEYRKNHPLPGKTDEEEDPEMVPVPPKAVEKKDCGRRKSTKKDADEDPELQEANETIARQDEDIQSLLDIIDTLLAEKEFDEADETEEEPVPEKEDDDEDLEEADPDKEDDDDLVEDDDEDEEELTEDDDEEPEDEFEEDDDEDEEELTEDDDEEPDDEFEEDDDEDVIPDRTPADLKPGEVMNADSVDRIVRARVKIGIAASQLNMDGLNNMSMRKAKKRIIKAVRPRIRLDGKSPAYINAMFDLACEELRKANRKGTAYQRKQMFNKDSRSVRKRRSDSAEAHRDRMIARRNKRNK